MLNLKVSSCVLSHFWYQNVMSIESLTNWYKHNSELLLLLGGVVYVEHLVMPYRGKPNMENSAL